MSCGPCLREGWVRGTDDDGVGEWRACGTRRHGVGGVPGCREGHQGPAARAVSAEHLPESGRSAPEAVGRGTGRRDCTAMSGAAESGAGASDRLSRAGGESSVSARRTSGRDRGRCGVCAGEEVGVRRRRVWGGGGRGEEAGVGEGAGVGEKRGGDEAGWGRAGAEGGGMRAPTTRRSVGSRDAVDDRPHQGNARTCGVGPMGASPDGDGTGCAGSRGGLGEPRGRGHEGRDDAVADGPNTPRNRRSVSRETVKGAHAGRRSPGGRSGLLQEPSRVGEEVLRGQLTRRFM